MALVREPGPVRPLGLSLLLPIRPSPRWGSRWWWGGHLGLKSQALCLGPFGAVAGGRLDGKANGRGCCLDRLDMEVPRRGGGSFLRGGFSDDLALPPPPFRDR